MKGSNKTVSQWQKTFWNWLYTVKHKARKIFVSHYETGGGGPVFLVLTHLEERCLQIIGRLTVEGLMVRELGLQKQSPKTQKRTSKRIRYPIPIRRRNRTRSTKIEKDTTCCFRKYSKVYATGLYNVIEALVGLKHAVMRLINLL